MSDIKFLSVVTFRVACSEWWSQCCIDDLLLMHYVIVRIMFMLFGYYNILYTFLVCLYLDFTVCCVHV